MAIALVIIMGVTMTIAILWTRGIDYMQKNHPDYKGKDLFNEDDEQS